MMDVLVFFAAVCAIAFVAAWLFSPALRARIERPKYGAAGQPAGQGEARGMASIVILCCAVGAVTVGATLTFGRGHVKANGTSVPAFATEEYGQRLLAQTSELLGPDTSAPSMRYAGNRLSCGSCHMGTGAEPGTLSLPAATHNYPRFVGRTNTTQTIEDRINECMQRSMNGRPLPKNSPEMIAMAAYMYSLTDRDAATGSSHRKGKEPPAFQTPARAASPDAGKQVFEKNCVACHGTDGLGLLAAASPIHGYVFPPLWGPDSFNDGAGMHRVLTAAKFIKARMPLGRPDLTDDQAFDVAGYINSQPRPEMPNLERDYPDRRTKQIDTAYGPFADPFPLAQHQYGPFQPIEAYYKNTRPPAK
jgi:thiosulfate dehydrogenase